MDNDINHKMKASSLYDKIIQANIVQLDGDKLGGFRNRLSKYLKELGLKKKRYNDGFYYYGIVENPANYSNKPQATLEELEQKRLEEWREFMRPFDLEKVNT